jgi:hypothetical protein
MDSVFGTAFMPRLLRHLGFLLAVAVAPAYAQSAAGNAAVAAPAVDAGKAAPAATTKPANTAGTVDFIEGDVKVFDAARVRRSALKTGDTLNEGDSVVTSADGELHVSMQDGGYIAVRPNTAMRFTKYQANGDDSDVSVIGLLKGTLRSVTGFIGQLHPRSYKINTPTATIGVRGTDHEAYVIGANDAAGEAGTYDKVNSGGTFLQTPQGRTEVSPNQAGFAPRGGNAKPRVLDKVPGFFKPTRNEHLIEKRVAARPKLQQLREKRQQESHERAAQKSGAKAASGKAAAAGDKMTPREQRQAERQKAQQARQDRQAAQKKTREDKAADKNEKDRGGKKKGRNKE